MSKTSQNLTTMSFDRKYIQIHVSFKKKKPFKIYLLKNLNDQKGTLSLACRCHWKYVF
jgi:hypothetical protein